jgi:hypothetical protein
MKKAILAVAVLGVVSIVPSWSAGASVLTLPRTLTGLSAAQITTLSFQSAIAQGTCTNVSHGAAAGYSFGSSTNSGTDEAKQQVTFNKSSGEVLLIRGVLFVKESAPLIILQFGKADPKYANKWISIGKTRKDYHAFATGLTFSSMISQVRPAGKLRMSKVGTLHGVKVIAIYGTANAELGLTGGVETLFVRASAPYLPLELAAAGRSQGVPTTLTVTFSNWGHRFSYSAPQGAIPISTTNLP